LGVGSDLLADWELVWDGDWSDFGKEMVVLFALFLTVEVMNAAATDIQAGE
jgi:hypothetical protein